MTTPTACETVVVPATRVGFSYGKGAWLSKLIRLFTRAPCSHTWLLYWDVDFACDMVMEAHYEWRLIPYDVFERQNHIVAVFEPCQSIDAGLREGGRLLGSRYDVGGLFGNLVVLLGEVLRRRWANPFRSQRTVFCSEGVARVLVAAHYPGSETFDLHAVRPEHILNLLSQDGSRRQGVPHA